MSERDFTTVIKPKNGWFDINLKDVWRYRDLIMLFVMRTFTVQYKQTVLGPLWFIINPLLTTFMFTVVFGRIAKIPTDGVPDILFYMAGNTAWSYFATSLTQTSSTFVTNSTVFGKVYFPRLVVPVSVVISGLLNFAIQLVLFFVFLIYFMFKGTDISPNIWLLYIPVLILQMALLGLGFGIIISSLTTKYRDLSVLVTFGIQLWMYATPIVYPLSQVPNNMKTLALINPLTPVVETFRYAFLGCGEVPTAYLLIGWIGTIVVLFFGVVLFSRVEKTFMDTV